MEEKAGTLVPCKNIAILQTKFKDLLWSSDAHYVDLKSHWMEGLSPFLALLFTTML